VEDQVITIIGCGPGSPDYMTPEAVQAANRASVLIGAARLLDLFPETAAERIPAGRDIDETLAQIQSRLVHNNIAVLVTGDPGLFSLASSIIKRFGRDRCRMIPGISSVQSAFARIGMDWADARIISAHKQDPDPTLSFVGVDKIAVLTGRESSLKWIAMQLLPTLEDRRVFVCENLTLKNEAVREVGLEELTKMHVSPTTVVLIVKGSLFA
jgi:cobalt-precorrin-7 (C5)-methyltransferase